MTRMRNHIHIHAAGTRACTAGNASRPVNPHLHEGKAVEEGVERTQGTEPFAERPIEEHAQNHHCQKEDELPAEEHSQGGTDTGICGSQGQSPLQNTLRAELLAEKRLAHSSAVRNHRRKQDHEEQEHQILQIAQWRKALCR